MLIETTETVRLPASLLGRLSAEILERPRVGDMLVALGWELAREGRKRHTASALLDADGRTIGRARAIWVQLRTELRRPSHRSP